MYRLEQRILVPLFLSSISILLLGLATAYSGKVILVFPCTVLSFIWLLVLAINLAKLTPKNQTKMEVQEPSTIMEYISTWIPRHPFMLTACIGFLFYTYFDLKSLAALKIIFPAVQVTHALAYTMLSVFLFYGLFYFVVSNIKNVIAKVAIVVSLIIYVPVYFYVGTAGLMLFLQFILNAVIGGMLAMLKNDVPANTVFIGSIVLIGVMWIFAYIYAMYSSLSPEKSSSPLNK